MPRNLGLKDVSLLMGSETSSFSPVWMMLGSPNLRGNSKYHFFTKHQQVVKGLGFRVMNPRQHQTQLIRNRIFYSNFGNIWTPHLQNWKDLRRFWSFLTSWLSSYVSCETHGGCTWYLMYAGMLPSICGTITYRWTAVDFRDSEGSKDRILPNVTNRFASSLIPSNYMCPMYPLKNSWLERRHLFRCVGT